MKLTKITYSMAFYKLGDKYYAARSNEFGSANYEVQDKAPLYFNPLSKDMMESKKDQADYLHASEVN